ncbi:MAG: T9SS type A sorting domain-containing protein [bacterium]|nr:T9SS type A sorting domain-containing protein [bacterium]
MDENTATSGFKIYKSNIANMIVDSLVVNSNLYQTYVTNFVKVSETEYKFAVSIGFKVNGIRIYKVNSLLKLMDSVDIIDNNFLLNSFSYANLIQGPEKEILLNTLFYNEDFPYNVYYQIDNSFHLKNQYIDSTTFNLQLGSYSEITSNILYFKNSYVMMSLADPLSRFLSHTIKRFSRDLELVTSAKVAGSYLFNIYHSPLEINHRWYIGNVFYKEFEGNLGLMPNFIEIRNDDSVINKSNYFKKDEPFAGGTNIRNFNALFDSIEQRVYLTVNYSYSGEIGQFCYDTSFNLLWNKNYSYPVNKIDTIYTKMQSNGVLLYNSQFYLYGVKQELLKWNQLHGPNKPFIIPIRMLDERILLGEKESTPILNALILFPNPCKDKIYLRDTRRDYSISIYNQIGQLVLIASFDIDKKVDVDKLTAGLYFYTVFNKNEFVHSGKLVKE